MTIVRNLLLLSWLISYPCFGTADVIDVFYLGNVHVRTPGGQITSAFELGRRTFGVDQMREEKIMVLADGTAIGGTDCKRLFPDAKVSRREEVVNSTLVFAGNENLLVEFRRISKSQYEWLRETMLCK